MKRLLAAIAAIGLFLVFAFFTYDEGTSQSVQNDNMPYVGLLQLTSHPSLDQISEGTVDALADNGYIPGETMELNFQNAQGDQANLASIATQYMNNNADLMVGVATPAVQALANASEEVPIIMGAVSDPVHAGLVEDLENPGGNITGVSDFSPIEDQINLLLELVPDAENIGILHSSSEENAIIQGEEAAELIAEKDLNPVTMTVANTNDVNQVGAQLATQVDAIWVPNDNVIASAFPSLVETTNAENIPVIPAVDAMVSQGGLATVGINQYSLGYLTGEISAQVLDGKDPGEIPIQYSEELDLVVNYDQAENLGITVPEDIQAESIPIDEYNNGEEAA